MPYTTEEGGRLNNFAQEPKMYQAQPLSAAQKRTYWLLTIATLVLVGGLVAVAALAS